MIETDKGWSTEEIMEIPLCRIRQLLELIIQDRREQMKFHAQLVEWQTKNLAAMFSVAARDKNQAREINKIVKKMSLPLADEQPDIIDDRKFDEVVENGANIDLDAQPSFEALMGAFGDMQTQEVTD